MKVTTVIRKRLSQHILGGRVVTVDHLRKPVTYSVLPASGGRWRVRKSWTRALDPDSQEITTIVVFRKGERDSAERFAASLAPSPKGEKP
jgi:hypothetical protein